MTQMIYATVVFVNDLKLSSDDSSTMLSPPSRFCDNVRDISLQPQPDQFGDMSILSESVEMDPDDPLLCADSPPEPDNAPSTPAMENMLWDSGTHTEVDNDTMVELEEAAEDSHPTVECFFVISLLKIKA